MLAYKVWRETRARFGVGVVGLVTLVAVFIAGEHVFRARMVAVGGAAISYAAYVELRIFAGLGRAMYLVLAVVLGLGGFVRERGHGTLGFTLALPVPRAHHAVARAAVGLAELVVLAAAPAVLVPSLSAVAGEAYPWLLALAFFLPWLAIGALVFAIALLTSIVVRNDYTALVITIVGLRLAARAIALPAPVATAVAAVVIALATAVIARQQELT